MAEKKLIENQPRFGDLSQYNFPHQYEENPPNYEDSTSIPKNSDKFQKKDLYTTSVGSELNNAIIERNLKAESGTSFIRIDRLYISERSPLKSGNNRCEIWLFSQEDYITNFDTSNYETMYDNLKNETRFYRGDRGQIDGGKDWGQASGLDGQNIIQELQRPAVDIDPENFSGVHTAYSASYSFPLRDTAALTTIIDENVYNPIYFIIRLRGDETEGHGTDKRKRRIQVYKINNLELFDYAEDGTAIPKITYYDSTNLIPYINNSEGDGGGSGDEKGKWEVNSGDFHVSISTMGNLSNDWEADPEDDEPSIDYIGPDEKLYEQYFSQVEPPIFFDNNFRNPINILNISPNRQLNNSDPPGPTQQFYFFPDYFPTTTIKIMGDDEILQDNDLQSYYEDNEQLSLKTSAPATIGLDLNLRNLEGPNIGSPAGLDYFYFVINWDDKDNNIKTLDDWENIRPTDLFELFELQKENLYKMMEVVGSNITKEWTLYGEGYGGNVIPNPYVLFGDELGFEQGEDFGGLRHHSLNEADTFLTANKACQLLGHTRYEWYALYNDGPGGNTNTEPASNLVYWDGEQWLKDSNENATGYYNRLDCVTDTNLGLTGEIPTHTYNTPGIKTIKTIIFSYNDRDSGHRYGRWKLVTSRFYLDIPINQYPDFAELGGSDYATLPWPYTTPIIGGVDENSKYKISIRDTLSGGKIGDTDIIDEKFLVNDFENDEMGKTINKMDLEQCRYFDKNYDMHSLLNINPITEQGGDPIYLEGLHLSTLPFPQYFEEFDLSGNSQITNEDANIWDNDYARPDIAQYIVDNIIVGDEIPPSNQVIEEPILLDNIITNGDFSTETLLNNLPYYLSGWTTFDGGQGSTEGYAGGIRFVTTNVGNALQSATQNVLTPGKQYVFTYDVTYIDSTDTGDNNLHLEVGGADIDIPNTEPGLAGSTGNTLTFVAEGTNFMIKRGGSNISVTLDNISVQEVSYPEVDEVYIDYNQYYNEEYFDSSLGIYLPYNDSYWDGDVNKFPMESSVGQIFISDNQENDLKHSCKLELNTGELSGKSIIDTSGNSNKGLVIGDYKVKKTRKGEPMRRDSFIKVPKKTNNKNGAL